MKETSFIILTSDQLKRDFFNAAKGNDRNGTQLIRDFMREYINKSIANNTANFHAQEFKKESIKLVECINI